MERPVCERGLRPLKTHLEGYKCLPKCHRPKPVPERVPPYKCVRAICHPKSLSYQRRKVFQDKAYKAGSLKKGDLIMSSRGTIVPKKKSEFAKSVYHGPDNPLRVRNEFIKVMEERQGREEFMDMMQETIRKHREEYDPYVPYDEDTPDPPEERGGPEEEEAPPSPLFLRPPPPSSRPGPSSPLLPPPPTQPAPSPTPLPSPSLYVPFTTKSGRKTSKPNYSTLSKSGTTGGKALPNSSRTAESLRRRRHRSRRRRS